jgi:small subunit ribosomal protein S20
MPNIKSAEKRMRQNAKRRVANRAQRSALRTAIKKARTAVQETTPENAQVQMIQTISIIDKSAQKGLIHKNKAARHASRLMKVLNTTRPEKAAS